MNEVQAGGGADIGAGCFSLFCRVQRPTWAKHSWVCEVFIHTQKGAYPFYIPGRFRDNKVTKKVNDGSGIFPSTKNVLEFFSC